MSWFRRHKKKKKAATPTAPAEGSSPATGPVTFAPDALNLTPSGNDPATPRIPERKKRTPGIRPEDLAFVDTVSQAVLEKPTRGSQLLVWVLFLLVATLLAWAWWAELDVLVRGQGRVIPSSQLQVVQSLEGGIVREILVKSGDKVRKNQVLMRLDHTQFASTLGEHRIKQEVLKARIARLRAQAENRPLQLDVPKAPELRQIYQNEIDLYRQQKKQLETQLQILKEQIRQKQQALKEAQSRADDLSYSYNLIQKEIRITEPLVEQGYAPRVDLLKLQREASRIHGDLSRIRHTIPKIRSAISEARSKLKASEEEFRNKAREQLNEALAELAALEQTLTAQKDRVLRTELKSPVDGTVKRVLITTVGGVLKPGDPAVEIVPTDDTLVIEVRIAPKDVGFLRPGLKAKVKFTAYDFSIYGGLEGVVDNISADTITDEKGNSFYLVRVRTNRSYLGTPDHPLPLLPGMIANVDIIVGKQTVMHYLLKPIIKARENALRER